MERSVVGPVTGGVAVGDPGLGPRGFQAQLFAQGRVGEDFRGGLATTCWEFWGGCGASCSGSHM